MRIFQPLCLVSLTCFALLARAAEDNLQRASFREVDTLFANPGQGWMSRQTQYKWRHAFPMLGSLSSVRLGGRRAAGGPIQLEVH
jgi:hypothetical protein